MSEIETNVIHCGDNLDVMRGMPDEYVDLIYANPPLFIDGFKGGVQVYVGLAKDRMYECYRLMKPNGYIYLRSDMNASHYLKVMMDSIFGYDMFLYEIILRHPFSSKRNDIILVYSKTRNSTLNDDISTIECAFNDYIGDTCDRDALLLDSIVKVSSNVLGVVMDPFCRNGDMIVSAYNLGRRWIGIDKSSDMCVIAADRFGIPHEWIIGMRMKMADVLAMSPHVFQHWVCGMMKARDTNIHPDRPSGADGGVDGFVLSNKFTVGYEGAPIQIKQRSGVGVDDIKKFFGTMDNECKKIGFFVAISFGRGAVEQVATYRYNESAEIILVKVSDIINLSSFF